MKKQVDIIFQLFCEAVNYFPASSKTCEVLQTFAVIGSMFDLDVDNLSKNIYYKESPFFFSKAWRNLQYNASRLEFDFPLLAAYETGMDHSEMFTRGKAYTTYSIQLCVLDKLPREAGDIQGECASRTKEQIWLDTERMLLDAIYYLNDVVVIKLLPGGELMYLHQERLSVLISEGFTPGTHFEIENAKTNEFSKMLRQLNPTIQGQRFEGGKHELLGTYVNLRVRFDNCPDPVWDFTQPDFGSIPDRFEKFRQGIDLCPEIDLSEHVTEENGVYVLTNPLPDSQISWEIWNGEEWVPLLVDESEFTPTESGIYQLRVLNENCEFTYDFEKVCPDINLSNHVEYSDECTYFITIEDPDNPEQTNPLYRRIEGIPNSVQLKYTSRFKYQSTCEGIIETVDEEFIGESIRAQYNLGSANQIAAGGYFHHLKVRKYDPSDDSEEVITIPLAPGTAMLTGCAGTVNSVNLIYTGINGTVWRNAVIAAATNYLCSLGYIEGENFIIGQGSNLTQRTPHFRTKHLPESVWIGIRTSNESESDAISWTSNGTTNHISSSTSPQITVPNSILIRECPCGEVIRMQQFSGGASQDPNAWRDFTGTSQAIFSGTDQQQTCPINLYDFDPPECEGANWAWQYSFDGEQEYETVQEGGAFFEPLEQGYYRLQYTCENCVYYYPFQFFIP
jgi:hypothetical protein